MNLRLYLYNRMETFVRWQLMRKYVKQPDTVSVDQWRAALPLNRLPHALNCRALGFAVRLAGL